MFSWPFFFFFLLFTYNIWVYSKDTSTFGNILGNLTILLDTFNFSFQQWFDKDLFDHSFEYHWVYRGGTQSSEYLAVKPNQNLKERLLIPIHTMYLSSPFQALEIL